MREMGGITVEDSDIALDLELMGGNYNFILLVNCESGLKKIREEHMIPDPRLLTEKTGSIFPWWANVIFTFRTIWAAMTG